MCIRDRSSLVYVNLVGSQDDLIFDGGSFVMDKLGKIVIQEKFFEESETHFILDSKTKKEQIKKVESLLDEFGLQAIRKSRGDLLSGGERRRTEIARALATNPSFILLDEPFAGVDPLAVEDIQKIVRDLTKRNIGILITDHNVQETLAITDRTYLMFEGSILKLSLIPI